MWRTLTGVLFSPFVSANQVGYFDKSQFAQKKRIYARQTKRDLIKNENSPADGDGNLKLIGLVYWTIIESLVQFTRTRSEMRYK